MPGLAKMKQLSFATLAYENKKKLTNPAAEESLYEIESRRRFTEFELGDDAIPDETTLLNFRHLLEDHNLTRKIFEDGNAYLGEKC